MQTVRNVAIILVLALGVYAIPGGGTAAETVIAALVMGFLAAIAFFVYRLYRQNQLTLMTLTDGRRAVLYGAFGVIALMVAGTDELLSTGLGAIAWIALIGASAFAIFRVWVEANTY
jgi:hypothetical protein